MYVYIYMYTYKYIYVYMYAMSMSRAIAADLLCSFCALQLIATSVRAVAEFEASGELPRELTELGQTAFPDLCAMHRNICIFNVYLYMSIYVSL